MTTKGQFLICYSSSMTLACRDWKGGMCEPQSLVLLPIIKRPKEFFVLIYCMLKITLWILFVLLTEWFIGFWHFMYDEICQNRWQFSRRPGTRLKERTSEYVVKITWAVLQSIPWKAPDLGELPPSSLSQGRIASNFRCSSLNESVWKPFRV